MQPLARVDLPKNQRGKDREQHHCQTARPLGSRTVVILAAYRWVADQSLAVVVVQRNPWIVDEQRQTGPMFVQAHKHFTARLAKLVFGQFDISLSSHRDNVLTQSGIGRRELVTPDRVLQSLAIETIQLANAAQPPKSPGRQFG